MVSLDGALLDASDSGSAFTVSSLMRGARDWAVYDPVQALLNIDRLIPEVLPSLCRLPQC